MGIKDSIALMPVRHVWRYCVIWRREFVAWWNNRKFERIPKNKVLPKVLGLDETMRMIMERRLSVSRLGDGEFDAISGGRMIFQQYDNRMVEMLKKVLSHPVENCLVCIPDVFGDLSAYIREERYAWRVIMGRRRKQVEGLTKGAKVPFGDAFISRCYLRYRDSGTGARIFAQWKRLFANRNLLVVEGRYSRLGIGNDLFSGASAIRRIWCPAVDAFGKYDEIKAVVLANVHKDDLVLLALGATAAILAYELAKEGLWAIDCGHLDVEYMWMKMGATKKVAIPGRYVSEAAGGQEQVEVAGEEAANNVVAVVEG